MSYTKKEFLCPSSDGIHTLSGVIYLPEGEAKAYFHIVHGMTEHIGRYDRIMSDLAAEGYICFGYDNLGHGKTARDESEFGYIAKKKGWDLLARDVKVFSDAVKTEIGLDLPYCLMGHSMGSFITRVAVERYVTPDRFVIMGTGGPNPAAGAGLALISLIKLFKGDRHISTFIDKVAFGTYNSRFEGDSDFCEKSWLTTDQSIREKYLEDGYCTFKFTVSAMGDLMRLLKLSNRGAWFKNLPDIPLLIVSGEDDPVGGFGKGIRTVEKKLLKAGKNVKCLIYKGARHEILNDFTYDTVKNDIISFIR